MVQRLKPTFCPLEAWPREKGQKFARSRLGPRKLPEKTTGQAFARGKRLKEQPDKPWPGEKG
jgi:hypothetical protein